LSCVDRVESGVEHQGAGCHVPRGAALRDKSATFLDPAQS